MFSSSPLFSLLISHSFLDLILLKYINLSLILCLLSTFSTNTSTWLFNSVFFYSILNYDAGYIFDLKLNWSTGKKIQPKINEKKRDVLNSAVWVGVLCVDSFIVVAVGCVISHSICSLSPLIRRFDQMLLLLLSTCVFYLNCECARSSVEYGCWVCGRIESFRLQIHAIRSSFGHCKQSTCIHYRAKNSFIII